MGDINWITLILVIIICVSVHRILFPKKQWKLPLPPSPGFRLPVLGHLLRMDPDLRKPLRKFRKQCGDVYSLYFGKKLVIVLGGYDTIKEAFHKKGELFANRPYNEFLEVLSRGKGLANTNGEVWRDHRRFSLTTLKDFGMGKSILEQKIHQEIETFQDAIERNEGQPFDPKDIISISVSNIICSLIFSVKHQHGDPKFMKIISIIDEIFRLYRVVLERGKGYIETRKFYLIGFPDFLPLLAKLPGDLFRMKKMKQQFDDVYAFTREIIEDHLKEHDDNIIDDFTSAYIKEMKRMERTQQSTHFSYEQLTAVLGDLISAGSETTTTSLQWSIICLVNYPEKQERMFTEIAEHVGSERLPSVGDRPNLTYVDAFYMEVLRFCNILIIGVLRGTIQDIEFKGYTIPKEALILPDFDSVFTDEHIWGDPDNFRPERFLDENRKLLKPEEFIPFSIGKRSCVGESLAKMELFLFLSSLVQKFKLECPNGEDLSMNAVDGQFGITHAPKPFKIIARSR